MVSAILLAKRNYWIAGIGAVICVIAFLFFPFMTFESSQSLPILGINHTVVQPVNTILAFYNGWLWVSLLFVLAVLGTALVFLLRRAPFDPRQVQARGTGLGFVVAGVLSAVFLVFSLLTIQQNAQNVLGVLGFLSIVGVSVSVTWALGVYLFLAGLIVIVSAGFMQILFHPTW